MPALGLAIAVAIVEPVTAAAATNYELREDGSKELREDGTYELRE